MKCTGVHVHVHEDGDIELKRYEQKPRGYTEELYFEDEQALRKELLSYGVEEDRITEALKGLKIETEVII